MQAVEKHNLPSGSWVVEGRARLATLDHDGTLSLYIEDGRRDPKWHKALPTARYSIGSGESDAAAVHAAITPGALPYVLLGVSTEGVWGVVLHPYDGPVLAN